MTNMEKKRVAKLVVGTAVYTAGALKTQNILKERIQRQPHKDIAVQLGNTFWAICMILYRYHVEKE